MEEEKFVPSEPVFVPAKEGEEAPEGVFVPVLNRQQRRALEHDKSNKMTRGDFIKALMPSGKELLANPEFRADIYKRLYENYMQKKDKFIEENKKHGDDDEAERTVQI